VEDGRAKINAALYGETLSELRGKIGRALASRERVAILIDNLDKAWDAGADLELLSRFLLGLLGVVGRVVDEFGRENRNKASLNVTLTVFLRSDIFAHVRASAREPDKMPVAEIGWRSPDLLARVLEDRFLASRDDESVADDLWSQYFEPGVRGMSSRDYLLSRVQPRPRDLVVFANSAVIRATNAKHARISEEDILEAEKDYSRFAYDSLLVEGIAFSVNLEDVLVEFAGEESIIEQTRLVDILSTVTREEAEVRRLTTVLRQLGFIGVETTDGRFDYNGSDSEIKRADVLVRKFENAAGRKSRFEIHPAYRAHLEIRE
jgi:hypothetical protein